MSSNPTVIEMVAAALKSGGFDGLFNTDGECACQVGDLAPCGEICEGCEAGYYTETGCGPECESHDGDCDWHIQREKPEAGEAVEASDTSEVGE